MEQQTVAAYSQSLSRSSRREEIQPASDSTEASSSLRFSQHLDGPSRSPVRRIAPSPSWGSNNAPPERLLASAGFFGGFAGEGDAFGDDGADLEDDFLDGDVARAASSLVAMESAAVSRRASRRESSPSPNSCPRSLSSPQRPSISPQPFYSEADKDGDDEEAADADAQTQKQLTAEVAANPLMRLPPGLPNVDSHIGNPSLHYAQLVPQRGFRKRPSKRRSDKGPANSDEETAGNFTVQQIRAVVDYIDDLGPSAAGGTAGDGGVDAHELENAFRVARRCRVSRAFLEGAKKAIAKLEMLLSLQDKAPMAWFTEIDSGLGNGRLSVDELKNGLATMTSRKAFRKYEFSASEQKDLFQFMDPNGDGSLDESEFMDALRRAKAQPDAAEKEAVASGIMQHLEEFMVKRQLRVSDLFALLDADKSGFISFAELKKGLVDIAAPSPKARAAAKRAEKQRAAAEAQRTMRQHMDAELLARMKRAKATGAVAVLVKLDKFMHDANLRVKDLFSKSGFDTSGDGFLDADEFMKACGTLGFEVSKEDKKLLMDFLDENGDGQVEASEIDAALRRLHKDLKGMAELRERKRVEESRLSAVSEQRSEGSPSFLPQIAHAKNKGHALATKARLHSASKAALRKPTEKINFHMAWLTSHDKAIGAHLDRAFSKV